MKQLVPSHFFVVLELQIYELLRRPFLHCTGVLHCIETTAHNARSGKTSRVLNGNSLTHTLYPTCTRTTDLNNPPVLYRYVDASTANRWYGYHTVKTRIVYCCTGEWLWYSTRYRTWYRVQGRYCTTWRSTQLSTVRCTSTWIWLSAIILAPMSYLNLED